MGFKRGQTVWAVGNPALLYAAVSKGVLPPNPAIACTS
jgi:hypothetical protein